MCSASEGKPQPLAITRSEGKGLRRRGNISLRAVLDLLKTSTLKVLDKEVTRGDVRGGTLAACGRLHVLSAPRALMHLGRS